MSDYRTGLLWVVFEIEFDGGERRTNVISIGGGSPPPTTSLPSTLSDTDWMQKHIENGPGDFFEPWAPFEKSEDNKVVSTDGTIVVLGRLSSVTSHTQDGTEYDEEFEIESMYRIRADAARETPATVTPAKRGA